MKVRPSVSAEETEVRFRDVDAVNLLRPVARQVESGTAPVVSGNILKDAGLLFQRHKVGDGDAGAVALGRGDQELNDTIRVRVSERLE